MHQGQDHTWPERPPRCQLRCALLLLAMLVLEEAWLMEPKTRLIAEAGLYLLRAEEETSEEFGVPITFFWVIAAKPVHAHQ